MDYHLNVVPDCFSLMLQYISHSYPGFSHVCCSLSDNFEEAAAATAAATTTATTTAVATTTITTQTNNKKMGKKVENKSISQVMANQEMSKRKRQIIWCGGVLNNIQIRRQIRTVGMYVFHLCKHSSLYKDKIVFPVRNDTRTDTLSIGLTAKHLLRKAKPHTCTNHIGKTTETTEQTLLFSFTCFRSHCPPPHISLLHHYVCFSLRCL